VRQVGHLPRIIRVALPTKYKINCWLLLAVIFQVDWFITLWRGSLHFWLRKCYFVLHLCCCRSCESWRHVWIL